MSAQVFRSVQRVYFDDLDALNILHNVRYLLFMERARGELFNSLGFRWDDAANVDRWHVVAAHEIRYVKPFRGEGQVAIEIAIHKIGHSSVNLSAKVCSAEDASLIYAEGTSRLVRIDEQSGKPCSWSETFRAAIVPMIHQ